MNSCLKLYMAIQFKSQGWVTFTFEDQCYFILPSVCCLSSILSNCFEEFWNDFVHNYLMTVSPVSSMMDIHRQLILLHACKWPDALLTRLEILSPWGAVHVNPSECCHVAQALNLPHQTMLLSWKLLYVFLKDT